MSNIKKRIAILNDMYKEKIDITICLLESAVRKPPVNRALIEEGLIHPSSKVQESATRLLETLDAQDN